MVVGGAEHNTAMNTNLLGAAGVSITAAVIALACAAGAAADPNVPPGTDPHVPNTTSGFCPGGGFGGVVGWGYCDGVPYPDGSYWHQVRIPAPFVGTTINLQCVVNDGSAIPPAAPPGGCGGAVR